MTDHPRRAIGGALLLAACVAPAGAQTAATQATGSDRETAAPIDQAASRSPASPATTAYPPDAAGDGATTGGYNQSRWAEDWTAYRDPAKRDDPFDRLKYLPLDPDGDVYLTLSGELRLRVNHTTNPNLADSRAQRQDINRIVGGADLHVGPHLRAYGELAHGGLSGVALGTPAATLRNDLIVQQAFVEATTGIAAVTVGARYGRQEFTDGPNLLTSARDNNTIRFVLNGWRGWARARSVRVDLFDFEFTGYGRYGTRDDRSDGTTRFSGVTAGVVLPSTWFGGSTLYVDPFIWRLRNDDALWGTTTSREARTYYGVHVWGGAGRVTIDWTLNHQGGRFAGRRIAAWQGLFAQTYRLGTAKGAPQIGVHADYASGGGAYGTGTLRSAFSPFGNNIYYSYQLFATPTNLVAVAPNVTVTPVKGVRVTGEYQLSWRDSPSDAVYRANGSAFAGTEATTARKIADTIRAQAVWSVTPRLSLTGRYEHLIAGPALTRAGYRNSDFLAGWVSFRF
jgi:hypothetical protein